MRAIILTIPLFDGNIFLDFQKYQGYSVVIKGRKQGTVLCFKTIFYLTKKRNKTIEIFKETGGKLISTVLELTGFRVNMIFRV